MDLRHFVSPFVGVLLGLSYGLLARLTFGGVHHAGQYENVFFGVSIAFLFLVPFALGVLTAALVPPTLSRANRWPYWVLMPCVSASLLLFAAMALAWEGFICIVMAAPIVVIGAIAGGIFVGLVVTIRDRRRAPPVVVASCLVLPFAFAPLEARLRTADDVHTVTTEIDVAADPSAVWRNVVRVPTIEDREQTVGLFQRIGIPQPLEATLDRDGVGGHREARFKGGIRFHEHVTEWEPQRALGFTIAVDAASVSSAVLDDHVRVGGPHFDVVYGRFELTPTARGTHLRLLSRHHLRTTLNAYAGLWTDAVMRDIQTNICRIIRARSEAAGPPAR
jgi:hypothetical protein